MEFIKDNRLAHFLQKALNLRPMEERTQLNNLRLCGSRTVKMPAQEDAAFLISNQQDARFFGITHCHSTWACPTCTAQVMAQRAENIACAIDALAKWHKEKAFMVTFTMPHIKTMSCKDSFNILMLAWRYFTKHKAQQRKTTKIIKTNRSKKGNIGDEVTYYKFVNINARFQHELKIKNYVRVYEFTWGENSWHPHIHALFWTPEKFDKILPFEKQLQKFWWKALTQSMKKYYTQQWNDKEKAIEFTNNIMTDWRENPKTGHNSFFISKDNEGKVRPISSSAYIAGWGGDKELTGLEHKKSKEGHLTPYQILLKAYEQPKYDPETGEILFHQSFWMNLYVEYCLATKKHIRYQFSKGVNDIIKKWKKTNEYQQAFKKKFMDKATAKWKVVCWFDRQQWSKICFSDNYMLTNIRDTILKLAIKPNAKELINSFLEQYSIKLHIHKHELEETIENKIFENVA